MWTGSRTGREPPCRPQGAAALLLSPNLSWAEGLEALVGSRRVLPGSGGGCSASWQGSSVMVAPGPKGSLRLAVSCCVMLRKRWSQVLWDAPEQRLRWCWCSGATG